MIDDNLCLCKNQTSCKQNKDKCTCTSYCELYAGTMAEYKVPRYVTVSPQPRDYNSIADCYTEWKQMFYKMRKHLNGGIFVLELAGGRPHFHLVLDIKDKIGFTSTIFSWQKYHNVKIHNKYRNGYHYLFKEVEATYDNTGLDPIYTYAHMMKEENDKHTRKSLERLRRKQNELDIFNSEIPAWMKGD